MPNGRYGEGVAVKCRSSVVTETDCNLTKIMFFFGGGCSGRDLAEGFCLFVAEMLETKWPYKKYQSVTSFVF